MSKIELWQPIEVEEEESSMREKCFQCLPCTKNKKKKEKQVSLTKIYRLMPKRYIPLLVLGIGASVINGATFPAFAIVFGEMFNSYTEDPDEIRDRASFLSLVFVGLGISSFVLLYISITCFAWIGEVITKKLRTLLYEAIIRKDVEFMDTHKIGELTSRISADVVVVQGGISEKIGQIISYNAQLLVGVAIAFVYGWKLTLVLLALSPLIIVSGAFQSAFLQHNAKSGQKAYSLTNSIVEETLSGFRTVSSFVLEDVLSQTFRESLLQPYRLGKRKAHLMGIGLGSSMFFIFGVYAFGFWYGSGLVADEEMDAGDLLIVFFSIMIGAMGLGQGGQLMPDVARAKGSATELFALMNEEKKIDTNEANGITMPPDQFKGKIAFRNVKFRYPTRKNAIIFHDLNLKIKPGKSLALVGSSGSGKSTCVQLIERFYDVEDGQVLIDGKNIKKYNLLWLRQQIGLVAQQPILFSCSIAENIRFGRPDATMKEIVKAAKKANAHRFIKGFPDGYHTRVGEKGDQMSGGQRQRIAIARAILKDPKILLLDEATSALDTESESLVQQALDKLMKGKTTIVIAHRLSTVQNADKIAVMHRGTISEQGTHQQLLSQNGEYALLVSKQMGIDSASSDDATTASEGSEELVVTRPKKKKSNKRKKKKSRD